MGTVIAARRTTLAPEVSGKIVKMSEFVIPGAIVSKGQQLVKIDPRDYETIVEKNRGSLAQTRMNLRLEQGNQEIAEQEYQMLSEQVDGRYKELVLRQPQLNNAQAALDAAQASLEKAKLDVKRCTIEAPFNGIIEQKHIDLGAMVSPSAPLVTVVGTDAYWVEVLMPVDKLRWIRIPGAKETEGSPVRVFNEFAWGDDVYRQGRILRLQGNLEEKGRMARLLVEVKDPLALTEENSEKPQLLIGSYVEVAISGKKLSNVIAIDREYVHNGNEIWLVDSDDQLNIRPVDIVFGNRNTVYVKDSLSAGRQIVTSDIAAPVEGMALRTENQTDEVSPTTEAGRVKR